MKTQYVLLVPMVAVIFGCATPAPVASNFPMSYQKVARAAHHWDVVADDVVTQTLSTIGQRPQLQGRSIFVVPAKSTAFNTAFREFMITHLVDHGADVPVCSMQDDTAGFSASGPEVRIQYDTQVISHGTRLPDYQPGRVTLLAAGVAVLRNAFESSMSRGEENLALIGAGALADWGLGHFARTTATEIIITTTIAENNRFVMRKSDIYYVPDADARLFVQRVAHRTLCPEDEIVASAHTSDALDAHYAREKMIMRDMRRVNPAWRGPAPTTYSY